MSGCLPATYIPGRRIEQAIDDKRVRDTFNERMGRATAPRAAKRDLSASEARQASYAGSLGLLDPVPLPTLDDWLVEQVGSARRHGQLRDFAAVLDDAISDGRGHTVEEVREYAFLLAREYLAQSAADFLGVGEVCERYGMKRMTLKRLLDKGDFPQPFQRISASPVWRERDLPQTVGRYTLKQKGLADDIPF